MDKGVMNWLKKARATGFESTINMANELEELLVHGNGDCTKCKHLNGFERVTYFDIGCKDCGYRISDEESRLVWAEKCKVEGSEIYKDKHEDIKML